MCLERCARCYDWINEELEPAGATDTQGVLCRDFCATSCFVSNTDVFAFDRGLASGSTSTSVLIGLCSIKLTCPPLNVSHFRTTITIDAPSADPGWATALSADQVSGAATSLAAWLRTSADVDPMFFNVSAQIMTADTARPLASAGTLLLTAESHSQIDMHRTMTSLNTLGTSSGGTCRQATGLPVACVALNITTYEMDLSGYASHHLPGSSRLTSQEPSQPCA